MFTSVKSKSMKPINALPSKIILDGFRSRWISCTGSCGYNVLNPSLYCVQKSLFRWAIFCTCSRFSILSECFGNGRHLERWKTILHDLIQGYHRVCALSEQEMAAVPYVIYSIQIICIACFSARDKYAELAETNIQMLRWLIANL